MNATLIAQPVNNSIYLRRRGKVVVPAVSSEARPTSSLQLVATALKNLEALGYCVSDELLAVCLDLPQSQFLALYDELVVSLKALRGARHVFEPMYPNFPRQVMAMREVTLYLNALVHYWSRGRLMPYSKKEERPGLTEEVKLSPIDLGTPDEFTGLFRQIVAANTAMSEQDKEDTTWFVRTYGDGIEALLPESLPNKENAAFVAGLLLQHVSRVHAVELVSRFMRTATDLLRLAAVLSGGDVSLAAPTKFRTFTRAERVQLLGLIDRLPQASATEDMLRWKGRWVRLGEKLHPGEFAKRFPNAAQAFAVLRNDEPFATFNSGVERAFADRNVTDALTRLAARPGDLARRLDHLLRIGNESEQDAAVAAFGESASKVSTPVLLQVRQHFVNRLESTPGQTPTLRVFFPKGDVAKAKSIVNTLPALPPDVCTRVIATCEAELSARFAALPALGKVYVDPSLRDYMAPFALRSASRSLRTLVRGSRLPLPPCEVLRFFIWWKNGGADGIDNTDIDLSAALFNDQFQHVDALSYYNLKNFGGVHSGDIVDAPLGASEFIDVTIARLLEANVRYVVMVVNSYSSQPFSTLPECFAGWMARQEPESGEVFEPKTVQDRLDLTANMKIAIPLVIDIVERKIIWCDMAMRRDPRWVNNVAGNLRGIAATLSSLVATGKPNLYDLFRLHAEARGVVVESREEADVVFSVEGGTPFRLEEIAADYMG